MWYKKEIHLEQILSFLIKLFLFVLPWQTIWIYKEQYLNGFKWQYGTLGFYATEMLLWFIIIIFMGWSWQRFKQKDIGFKFHITRDRIFTSSVLIFIVYVLTSSFWALDGQLAWQQGLRIMEMFLLFFVLILGPVDFWYSAKWFTFGALLAAALGLGQFLLQATFSCKWLGLAIHNPWVGGTSVVASEGIGRWLRAYGSFSHPNVFGGYMFVSIVSVALLFVIGFCSQKKYRMLQYLIITIFLSALLVSFSRTAIIACTFLLVVMFIYSFYNRKGFFASYYFKYLVALIFVLSLILMPLLNVRFGQSNSVYEVRSISERVSSVEESVEIFRENKLLGVGAGNYTLAVYNLNSNLEGWQYQPVHNIPLLILTEFGIVGFFLTLLVIISYFYFVYPYWQRRGKSWLTRNMTFIFNAVLLLFPFFIIILLDHYFYTSYIGLMMVGIYWAMWTKYSTQ